MAKILLIRPPIVFSSSTYSVGITMPLAIAYLSANLLKHGHEVQVIDALAEDIYHIDVSYSPRIRYRGLSHRGVLERVREKPDGIGITIMFSQDWPHVEDLLREIRAAYPDVPIIVGGEHPTAAADYVLETCPAINHVAIGEGEEIIRDWADWLDGKKGVEEIQGIRYRAPDGTIRTNPPRQRNLSPDDLPWPAWHLFDLNPYFEVGEGHGVERGRSMPLLATRGCPYQCTFCSNPSMWTTRYVMRSPGKVLDEIEHYMQEYGASNVDFADLTAIIKKEWILDFCRQIKARGMKFTWQLPSGTRSEAMDGEVLKEMATSGCMNVTYAPESGSVRTLQEIKKKVKLPRLFDSIRHAHKNGIFVKCNLIIGFPRETRQDMWHSVWCAIRFACMGVEDTAIYLFSPYPGSELYEYLRKKGVIGKMDRAYFESLMVFMDLKQSSNYCENVGAFEIGVYRLLGMGLFYTLSYLLYPYRILRSIRNYRQHRSDTLFELRLFGILRRMRLEKISATEGVGKEASCV